MEKHIRVEQGITKLILLYRYFSLVITSVIYLFSNPKGSLLLKISIITGLALASGIVTYLYINNQNNKKNIVILLIVEVLGNGVILAVSGGFASPYIWYFISTLLIASLELSTRSVIFLSFIYFAIALITTLDKSLKHITTVELTLYINIAMSYIMVDFGLLKLIRYAVKVEEKTISLSVLNSELNQAKKNIEKMFRFSIEIYETVNLFHLNDNKNVMEGLLNHFHSIVKASECMLVLLSPFENAGQYTTINITKELAKRLIKFTQKSQYDNTNKDIQVILENEKMYKIQFIQYANSVYGAFVYTCDNESMIEKAYKNESTYENTYKKESTYENELALFSKLAGIILTKMNYDEIGENLIISEEQNRIANEIHDIVLQKLFAISCNLFLLSTKCNEWEDNSKDNLKEELLDIRTSIDVTMSELRETIYGMSWEKVGKDSFEDKIIQYTKEVGKMNAVRIDIEMKGDTRLVTVNQKTALYRVICEAMNNAIRHGRASVIHILLSIEKNITKLTIVDNGIGFDLEKHFKKECKGIGIRNIYRIVTLLRGTIEFESENKSGTSIIIRIPHSE